MRTIEITATVGEDGTLTARVPPDIPAGEHRVLLVTEAEPLTKAKPLLDLPVISVGKWPANLSLRREDMYGEWGNSPAFRT